MSLLVRL
jgi:NADPH-dependent 2,4-dienoyl-CoA reductase/sulfur reductase-like enzyme